MALLMLDDGEDDLHVDMREVVKEAKKEAAGGGKKKLSRWKLSRLKVKERRLAKEGVTMEAVEETTKPAVVPAAPCDAVSDSHSNHFYWIF